MDLSHFNSVVDNQSVYFDVMHLLNDCVVSRQDITDFLKDHTELTKGMDMVITDDGVCGNPYEPFRPGVCTALDHYNVQKVACRLFDYMENYHEFTEPEKDNMADVCSVFSNRINSAITEQARIDYWTDFLIYLQSRRDASTKYCIHDLKSRCKRSHPKYKRISVANLMSAIDSFANEQDKSCARAGIDTGQLDTERDCDALNERLTTDMWKGYISYNSIFTYIGTLDNFIFQLFFYSYRTVQEKMFNKAEQSQSIHPVNIGTDASDDELPCLAPFENMTSVVEFNKDGKLASWSPRNARAVKHVQKYRKQLKDTPNNIEQ